MRLHHCKWLLAAGLLAGTVKAYQARIHIQEWIQRHRHAVAGLDNASPSEVYFLRTNRWLEFRIPKGVPLIRLISNAGISPSQPVEQGTQWPYAVQYQLSNAQGQINRSGIYHFKGEKLVFLDKATGEPVEVNSYLDHQLSPLSGREWMLNLSEDSLQSAGLLRLRLHSRHPDLVNVGIRVYYQTEVPERKLDYLWDRLSDDQKQDLARGNVYGPGGLSKHEQLCVVRFHWAVAAPEGIPGKDFERRTLYVREDSENVRELNDWLPSGILADASHSAVLPITNTSGSCVIQITDCPLGCFQHLSLARPTAAQH